MGRPRFLERVHLMTEPALDYFDVPKGYWLYASGMMMGSIRILECESCGLLQDWWGCTVSLGGIR